jgi:arginine-tRNA-protein transferase
VASVLADPAALARHEVLTRALAEAIERSGAGPGDAFPCPYLPGRLARHVTLAPRPFSPAIYQSLMDLNFRRLGELVYRPDCEGCAACRMLRVRVAGFRPTRSQRRAARRNRDLEIAVARPRATAEKHALYRRYLEARHDGQMDGSSKEFERFLYSSRIDTLEVEYSLAERVVGVGLFDVTPLALSAVYFYFDPALAGRSLGVVNVLWLVEEARRRSLPWLYLGYYVAGARTMRYKAGYGPSEVLAVEGGFVETP